jgi:hypothetical protein
VSVASGSTALSSFIDTIAIDRVAPRSRTPGRMSSMMPIW